MTVVFISEPLSITSNVESQALPVTTPQVKLRRLQIEDYSRFIRFDNRKELDTPSEADGDQTGHALLFGRYLGQVSARVKRAWLRPRAAVDGGSFVCRVQISQDMFGTVQEVTLQDCNGDLHWQASLVQAIQAASPLPAPPDPSVFSNSLTLQFESEAYVPGSSPDGYEAIRAASTRAGQRQ